jgi:putative cardiolipin synthase
MPRILCAFVLATAGCAALPQNDPAPSTALGDTSRTRLGEAVARASEKHPGKTGVYPLSRGRDAFASRVLLARAAERTLDVQYYIFRTDVTGSLLLAALWEAAERGVRVRVLLDDNTTRGMDPTIAALDAHANVEVRLFNPFANRGFRLGEMVTDFSRINRRMHNKSFTADSQATIVGGRNIGDEYFGAESAVEFADLDALAVGATVREVSASFDAYWNSASAFPAERLIPRLRSQEAAHVREAWSRAEKTDPYVEALRTTPLVQQLLAGSLPLEWADAHIVSDDPAKVLHPPERKDLHMSAQLESVLGRPARELDLVSPYFVPTKDGTAALIAFAQRGVKVRVLTNSLAATDVSAVHAGYSKVSRGSFARRRAPIRAQALRQRGARYRRLGREPARQDVLRRPGSHLHRLVQLRPSLGATQHGDGPRGGKCGARDTALVEPRSRPAARRVRAPSRR